VKTSRYVALCGVIFASLGITTPAFAQKYNQFANLEGVGDCQYETGANLVLHEFPSAKITTNEVVDAYNTFGGAFNSPLWEGQDFLISQGFDGHRASSITPISQAQVPYAASHGGVEVTNLGPVRMHAFALIAANKTHVVLVDDGFVYHYTWAWFHWAYTRDGEQLAYYAVTWA
jgi:hypothetical protein